jgi:hypothetical protein
MKKTTKQLKTIKRIPDEERVRPNRFRKLLIRWEKKAENYLALVQLACRITVYRRIPG